MKFYLTIFYFLLATISSAQTELEFHFQKGMELMENPVSMDSAAYHHRIADSLATLLNDEEKIIFSKRCVEIL